MPAKSVKQQRFMGLCAHNPKHARGKCPSKKVSKEFSHMGKGTAKSQADGLEEL